MEDDEVGPLKPQQHMIDERCDWW